MHKIVYVAVVALALSACSGDKQEEGGVAPAPQTTAPDAPAEVVTVDEIANAIEHVRQQAAVSVRYDRRRDLDEATERQVYVEMLGSTAEQTEALAVTAFEAAGFSVRKGLADAKGIRLQFRKRGVESINALIRDQATSPAFKDPAGTSSLYLRQVQKD